MDSECLMNIGSSVVITRKSWNLREVSRNFCFLFFLFPIHLIFLQKHSRYILNKSRMQSNECFVRGEQEANDSGSLDQLVLGTEGQRRDVRWRSWQLLSLSSCCWRFSFIFDHRGKFFPRTPLIASSFNYKEKIEKIWTPTSFSLQKFLPKIISSIVFK